jgi:hypothetical protein
LRKKPRGLRHLEDHLQRDLQRGEEVRRRPQQHQHRERRADERPLAQLADDQGEAGVDQRLGIDLERQQLGGQVGQRLAVGLRELGPVAQRQRQPAAEQQQQGPQGEGRVVGERRGQQRHAGAGIAREQPEGELPDWVSAPAVEPGLAWP